MKSGLFAFILLSALVHAVVFGLQGDWIFNINDSHEQGSSALKVDLLAKTSSTENTVISKPLPNISKKTASTTIIKIEPVKENLVPLTKLNSPTIKPQHIALLNTVDNRPISTANNIKSTVTSENKKPVKEDNTEKIKALLNNELSKYFYYPKPARRKNRQGSVLLAFSINSQGEINNIHINKSSGFKILDDAAIKALKQINANEDLAKALNGDSMEHTLPVVYKLTRH